MCLNSVRTNTPNAAWPIRREPYYATVVKVGFYVPRPRMAAAE